MTTPGGQNENVPNPYPFENALRRRLAGNVEDFDRRPIAAADALHAAVALVVAQSDETGDACLLLTRRSKALRRHAGQYALPGGRVDAGESLEQAALRELREELGLDYSSDAVLGPLDDYQTRSGFVITPYVVWGGPLETMRPDPIEVAVVFQIPLDDLDSTKIPLLTDGQSASSPVLSTPISSIGHVIHAPTAALIYQFREVAMHGRPTRVAHYDQPAFAWK